jgi:hypothetical protein
MPPCEDGGIGSEAPLPERIGEDDAGLRVELINRGKEVAAERGRDAVRDRPTTSFTKTFG